MERVAEKKTLTQKTGLKSRRRERDHSKKLRETREVMRELPI